MSSSRFKKGKNIFLHYTQKSTEDGLKTETKDTKLALAKEKMREKPLDFGTGNACMNSTPKVPATKLKIDM